MIHAALAGKLDCLGSEDALTSAVFGHLRYLPRRVLQQWLRSARPLEPDAPPPWDVDEFPQIDFWPSLKDTFRGVGHVEPDALLVAGEWAVIVEAKLWSGKSGAAFEGSEGEWQPADQLAREWRSAADHFAEGQRGR